MSSVKNLNNGGINIDGGDLFVNAVNNRVRIRNTNPLYTLDISTSTSGAISAVGWWGSTWKQLG